MNAPEPDPFAWFAQRRFEESRTWVEVARAWKPPEDLLTRDVQTAWAIERLIPGGKVGCLVAAGGTGKTTLLLDMCAHIALGRPWLGNMVARGTAVLLSADDPQEDLDTALALVVRAMGLTADQLERVRQHVRVISLQGLPGIRTFTAPHDGAPVATGLDELLARAVEGIDDLVCVVLDTLRQFAGGSTNEDQVILLTIGAATEFALRTGAFVVLPHHTGKQNYRDGIVDLYCGTGSAAIADNCRFVLLLQTTTWAEIADKVDRTGQEKGDPLVLTSTRGSLLAKAPPPLFLYRDGYRIGRVAGARLTAEQVADEKDRAVLRAVRKGAQTKNAIVAAIGGKRVSVFSRVDDLLQRGYLTDSQSGSSSRSVFMVSTAGARFLDSAE